MVREVHFSIGSSLQAMEAAAARCLSGAHCLRVH